MEKLRYFVKIKKNKNKFLIAAFFDESEAQEYAKYKWAFLTPQLKKNWRVQVYKGKKLIYTCKKDYII